MRVKARMVMRRKGIMKRIAGLVGDDGIFILLSRSILHMGSDGSWRTWLEMDCIMERRMEWEILQRVLESIDQRAWHNVMLMRFMFYKVHCSTFCDRSHLGLACG